MWIVVSPSQSTVVLRLLTNKDYYVGRRKADSDLPLADETVSKTHALLHVDENSYDVSTFNVKPNMMVRDLKSTCGTSVKGSKIKPQIDCTVEDGSLVQFGKKTVYKVVYEPMIMTVSGDVAYAEYESIMKACRKLGCHVLPQLFNEDTVNEKATIFISAPMLNEISISLASALVCQLSVVTTAYPEAVLNAVLNKQQLPSPCDFVPFESASQSKLQLNPVSARKSLFSHIDFFLYSTSSSVADNSLKDLITQAGGRCIIVNKCENSLIAAASIIRVIAPCESVADKRIVRLVREKGCRFIAPCEIVSAIMIVSTDQYTNARAAKPENCVVHNNNNNNSTRKCFLSGEASSIFTLGSCVPDISSQGTAGACQPFVKTEPICTSSADYYNACETVPPPTQPSSRRLLTEENAYHEPLLSRGRDLGPQHTSTQVEMAARPPVNTLQPKVPANAGVVSTSGGVTANKRRRPFSDDVTQDHHQQQIINEERSLLSTNRENTGEKRRRVESTIDLSRCSSRSKSQPQPQQSQPQPPTPAVGAWVSIKKSNQLQQSVADDCCSAVKTGEQAMNIKTEPCGDDEISATSLVVVKYTNNLFDPNCTLANFQPMRSALESTSTSQLSSQFQLSFSTTGADSASSGRPRLGGKIFKKVWPLHMVSNEQSIKKDKLVPAALLDKANRRRSLNSSQEETNDDVQAEAIQESCRQPDKTTTQNSIVNDMDDGVYSQRQAVFQNFFK